MLWLILVFALLTTSTAPSQQIDSKLQNESAIPASFAGSSTIFNTSTLGSIEDICIGPSGYLYVTGTTSSPSFPIVNGFDDILDGSMDCFVLKMNRTDGSIVYSSFLGGNTLDYPIAISVDDSGSIYILGSTYSDDFPFVNPYNDTVITGDQFFLTKFAPDGQSLVYSTFFGVKFVEGLNAASFSSLAVDELGNAYLAGTTINSTVPIVNAFDETYNGDTDCYILKMNPTGTEIVFASFYGTGYPDEGHSLFYAGEGIIYLSGRTSICPTGGYYVSPGPDYGGHCFVLKIADNGTLLGSGHVKSNDFYPTTSVVVNSEDSVYILDEAHTNSMSLYKFDNALELELKRIMNRAQFTLTQEFAIDINGFIYIAGRTFDSTLGPIGSYAGEDDCFLIRMNSNLETVFSRLYGTPLRERTNAMAVSDDGYVYLAGITTELTLMPPIESTTFIISISISLSLSDIFVPVLPQLLIVSLGITILILAIVLYRKRS
jgi:hypothetical protein